MLKIGTLALFSTSCFSVSMLAVMSPKDGILCIGLYAGMPGCTFYMYVLFTFIWLSVLAVQKY